MESIEELKNFECLIFHFDNWLGNECMCVCMYVCMFVCMHACVHTCVHA